MNVQSIHNATFLNDLPGTYLAQARALANWHQYNSFSAPQLDSIGNSASLLSLGRLRARLTPRRHAPRTPLASPAQSPLARPCLR